MAEGETLSFLVDTKLWGQLVEIGQVTDEHPADVALTILRAGAEARIQAMADEAAAEVFRLEAELTAARARQAGLNGSAKAPRSPRQPPEPPGLPLTLTALRQTVREVLNTDRHRTWTTGEVAAMLGDPQGGSGYSLLYKQVNNALRYLTAHGMARNPVRGQYTWRRKA
jgi:hypothetical protein